MQYGTYNVLKNDQMSWYVQSCSAQEDIKLNRRNSNSIIKKMDHVLKTSTVNLSMWGLHIFFTKLWLITYLSWDNLRNYYVVQMCLLSVWQGQNLGYKIFITLFKASQMLCYFTGMLMCIKLCRCFKHLVHAPDVRCAFWNTSQDDK